jgi:hypothetical protein
VIAHEGISRLAGDDFDEVTITLYDGNDELGVALYLRELLAAGIVPENLVVAKLYYIPRLSENAYL